MFAWILGGDEWNDNPPWLKGPNRGRRLRPRPRHIVPVYCAVCGGGAKRFRRSARYCSISCRRRAQTVRDALREGRPYPVERVRGSDRARRAKVKLIRKKDLYAALRFLDDERQQRAAEAEAEVERQWQAQVSRVPFE